MEKPGYSRNAPFMIVFISAVFLVFTGVFSGCSGQSGTSASTYTDDKVVNKSDSQENDATDTQTDAEPLPPPDVPRLLSPLNHATVNTPVVEFAWEKSISLETYTIRIYDDFLPGKIPVFEAATSTNSWKNTVPLKQKNRFYFWQVAALDNDGTSGSWSELFVFYYTDQTDTRYFTNTLWEKTIFADVFSTDFLTAVPHEMLSASAADGSVFLLGSIEVVPDFLYLTENRQDSMCFITISPEGKRIVNSRIKTGEYFITDGFITTSDRRMLCVYHTDEPGMYIPKNIHFVGISNCSGFVTPFTIRSYLLPYVYKPDKPATEGYTCIIELNKEGKLVNSRSLPIHSFQYPDNCLLRETNDRGFLLACTDVDGYLHIVRFPPEPDRTTWHALIRIDTTYGHSLDTINDMVVAPDNTLTGVFKRKDNNRPDECEDIVLFKFTASGELAWEKMLYLDPDDPDAHRIPWDQKIKIYADADGCVTMFFSVIMKDSSWGLGVIKVSADGNVIENSIISLADFSSIISFCASTENEYAILGKNRDEIYSVGIISGNTLRIIERFPVIDRDYCSDWDAEINKTADNNLLVSGKVTLGENSFPCHWLVKIDAGGKPLDEYTLAPGPANIKTNDRHRVLDYLGFEKTNNQSDAGEIAFTYADNPGLAFTDMIPDQPGTFVVYQWLKYLDIKSGSDENRGSNVCTWKINPAMADKKTGLCRDGITQIEGGTILEKPDIHSRVVQKVYEDEYVQYSTRSGLQTVIDEYQGYWYQVTSTDGKTGWLHGLIYTRPHF